MKQTIFPHQFIANPELIHRWANERYWDDELPNDVDVVYAKINHEASFKAKGRLRQYHLIELNEKLKDDPDKLLSVLVHKQIHLWQLVSSVRKSDSDYLDKEISTWIRHQHEAGREMKRFHGPSFYSQFARLHSDFGELKIDLSHEEQSEHLLMEDPIYLMHVSGRNGNGQPCDGLFWCSNPVNPESRKNLEAWAKEHYESVKCVRFGTSTDESAKQFTRLHNNGEPNIRQRPVLYRRSGDVAKFVNGDELTHWEDPLTGDDKKIEVSGFTSH